LVKLFQELNLAIMEKVATTADLNISKNTPEEEGGEKKNPY